MNDITNKFNMRDNRQNSPGNRSIRTIQKSEFSYESRTRSHSPASYHQTQLHNKPFQFQFQQHSKLYNSIKSEHGISNKRSRLDMLDNSQLTSFPLAPPPSSEKITENLRSPEINAQEFPTSRPDSQLFEIDPIVLVEDYIKSKQLGRKKLSVFDLKTSLKTLDSIDPTDLPEGPNYLTHAKSILSETLVETPAASQFSFSQTSSLLLTRCSADESSIATSDFYSSKTRPSLSSACSIHTNVSDAPTLKLTDTHDITLGELSMPASSSLKYCVICETPLYELSSLLTDDSKDSNYSEFVCSNCTERYEMLSRLIENFDMMTSIPEESFINDLEELLDQPANKKMRGDQFSGFSTHLINKLQNQLQCNFSTNSNQQIDRKSAMWLLEAKKKLRWRWRISGLLPQFLKED